MDSHQHHRVYDTDGLHAFYDSEYSDPIGGASLASLRIQLVTVQSRKVAIVTRLQLIADYVRGDETIRFLFNKFDIHMVPVANPDGYIYSRIDVSPAANIAR